MENGLLKTAISNFEESAKRLGLESRIYESLLFPKERIECTINPICSDGHHRTIRAFIVRHSDVLGPAKGGIRMSECVSLDDITGLAMEMTWKTALIGVPFGGGKSGICFDGAGLSKDDKEVIVRSFTRGMSRHIGPEIYIPAPDMGSNESDMGHIKDCIAYSHGESVTRGCHVTGKPIVLGGIVGRREATGTGVAYCVEAACAKLDLPLEGSRVVIQGFGNVGSVAASVLSRMGAKIIAVADVSGAVFNEDGLPVDALLEYTEANGFLSGFDQACSITSKELFELSCDILIPAAAQSQITTENADRIRAKIIAEGANGPIVPEADEILNDRGVFVVPDILCNAGGVFVSYLEYTQETQREQMTDEQVSRRLFDRMHEKFAEVYEFSKARELSMREAAMDIAVKAVAQGVESRGFHP